MVVRPFVGHRWKEVARILTLARAKGLEVLLQRYEKRNINACGIAGEKGIGRDPSLGLVLAEDPSVGTVMGQV
jgi:hypothetical protein